MDKFIKLTRLASDSPEYSNKPVFNRSNNYILLVHTIYSRSIFHR